MEALQNTLTTAKNNLKTNQYGEFEGIIYVDSNSLYWVTESDNYLFLAEHSGINDFIDNDHQMESGVNVEGVGFEGVYWNNMDFEFPFTISDIEDKIEAVNV